MSEAPVDIPVVPDVPKKRVRKPRVKKVHRQDKWYAKQVALGNCGVCGQPRGDSPFKTLCRRHGELKKLRTRRSHGSRPWKLGEKGSKPLDLPVRDREDVDRVYPSVPRQKKGKDDGNLLQ